MERFARIVIGYHGCEKVFANEVLASGDVARWQESRNPWDWLGRGIYFWEHAPERALRWAREHRRSEPDVVGAVIQLGQCFDLMNEDFVRTLVPAYEFERDEHRQRGAEMPENGGRDDDLKLRRLDCLVINRCLQVQRFQTVRGAFWEGDRAFPGAMIRAASHVQIAVRDRSCILGVFRPTLRE